jgi:hypothetical protein
MLTHPDGQTFRLEGHDEAYKRFWRLCECAWKELQGLGCEFVARIHQVLILGQVSEFCPSYSILNTMQVLRTWTFSVLMNIGSRKRAGRVTSVLYVCSCVGSSAIKIKFVNPGVIVCTTTFSILKLYVSPRSAFMRLRKFSEKNPPYPYSSLTDCFSSAQ